MLDRYRKPGGFVQLLKLLETCGPNKQTKFLEIIRSEDPRWADEIEQKMLRFERIFDWDDQSVSEIAGTLQDLTLANVFQGISKRDADRMRLTFPHSRLRRIDDLIAVRRVTEQDLQSTFIKVVETVRQMVVEGRIRLEKIDPELALTDNIEETLNGIFDDRSPVDPALGEASPLASIGVASNMFNGPSFELSQLRKQLSELGKENTALKRESQSLRSKLEQIKRIA